ncbi:MAG: hypothetical protein AAF828_00430 [Bacteroidota bacterium]
MRILFSIFTLLLLYTCSEEATNTPTPLLVSGEIRYLQDQQQLRGDVSFFRAAPNGAKVIFRPPAGAVAFMGSSMKAVELNESQRWRATMKAAFPEQLRFTFPTTEEEEERVTLPLQLSPPLVDSLPAIMDKKKNIRVAVGTQPLAENESIIVFFEPEDRQQAPRRIIVAGPTLNNQISLPATAMKDVAPGKHQVYLIKQQIAKDTLVNAFTSIQLAYHSRTKGIEVRE